MPTIVLYVDINLVVPVTMPRMVLVAGGELQHQKSVIASGLAKRINPTRIIK